MFSDKLLSLLNTFSKVELNRFRKYLLSPYLNEQPGTIQLFDLLNETIRKDDAAVSGLTKEFVWKALYANRKFDDTHLRRLASELNQLALRFMVAEYRQTDPLNEALDLQKALEKPLLTKHLASTERQILRLFDDSEIQSSELLLSQFRMHHQVFSRISKGGAIIGYAEKLSTADFYLECFYIIQKLKYYAAWLQFSGIRATEKIVPLMPGFWEYIEDERFKEVPLITVYRRVIKCFSEQAEEQHFNELLQDLDKYAAILTEENLRECYHMAQNYCALKISQGKLEYYRAVFAIFQRMIKEEILLENESLSEGMFKNIISASLGVGEFVWAENFIEKYAIYLPLNARENAKSFNLAYLYFHQKKYDKVIKLLQGIEYSDIAYALGAKQMLLRTYFEINELLVMDSMIDSFRIFIRRSKLMTKNLKREYNNLLNFLRIIATLNHQDKRSVEKIKKKIIETQYLNSKKWLLEKIAERELSLTPNKRPSA